MYAFYYKDPSLWMKGLCLKLHYSLTETSYLYVYHDFGATPTIDLGSVLYACLHIHSSYVVPPPPNLFFWQSKQMLRHYTFPTSVQLSHTFSKLNLKKSLLFITFCLFYYRREKKHEYSIIQCLMFI